MEFEVAKPKLLKEVASVSGIVERRNTIPILQNIKIEAANGKVSLLATDMDISAQAVFEAQVKSGGSTTVGAQLFYDIIRKIPDLSSVLIKQESPSSIQIKSGKSAYSLPCISASEFPTLADIEDAYEFEIETEKLARMIDRTRFAISNDETRYYLNGLYLQSVKNPEGEFELRAVATDGHRLTMSYTACPNLASEFGVILPKKAVMEIRRMVEGSKKVKIAVSRVKIKVAVDGITVVSKLIDGQFPDYEKVLPRGNNKIASLNKRVVSECVDRISTIATDKHRSVKFIVENSRMTLQVSTNDGSFAHEELDIDYKDEKIETGFNSRYFLDIVNQIDREDMMIKFKDGISPVIIETKGMNSVFVLMPVRV